MVGSAMRLTPFSRLDPLIDRPEVFFAVQAAASANSMKALLRDRSGCQTGTLDLAAVPRSSSFAVARRDQVAV
jgi:hypothetical protein